MVGCDLGAPPTTYAAPGNVVAVVDVQGDGHLDVVTWSPTEYGILPNDGTGRVHGHDDRAYALLHRVVA
jgi:hypothetical protein